MTTIGVRDEATGDLDLVDQRPAVRREIRRLAAQEQRDRERADAARRALVEVIDQSLALGVLEASEIADLTGHGRQWVYRAGGEDDGPRAPVKIEFIDQRQGVLDEVATLSTDDATREELIELIVRALDLRVVGATEIAEAAGHTRAWVYHLLDAAGRPRTG